MHDIFFKKRKNEKKVYAQMQQKQIFTGNIPHMTKCNNAVDI